MATKETLRKTPREREASRAREERRLSESTALARASASYSRALDMVSDAVSALVRGASALDIARASAVSPDLVQYGLVSRLRPADLQRAVHGISRELSSKLSLARSSNLVVPDGTEEAYRLLVSRLSDASDLIANAILDFGKSVPRSSAKPHPVIRDVIVAASGGASLLNRLIGRARAAASVHVSAVRDDIVSEKDVSFY